VKTVGQQGIQEGRNKGGLDVVYGLPHGVRDVVGARGGGVREFGEGPGYLLSGEGCVVLIAVEAEERGGRGFGGEKVVKKRLSYLGRVGGPRQVWEPLWWSAERESLGRPD